MTSFATPKPTVSLHCLDELGRVIRHSSPRRSGACAVRSSTKLNVILVALTPDYSSGQQHATTHQTIIRLNQTRTFSRRHRHMHNCPIFLRLHLIHWLYQSSGYICEELRINVRALSQAPVPRDPRSSHNQELHLPIFQPSHSREGRPMVFILEFCYLMCRRVELCRHCPGAGSQRLSPRRPLVRFLLLVSI